MIGDNMEHPRFNDYCIGWIIVISMVLAYPFYILLEALLIVAGCPNPNLKGDD